MKDLWLELPAPIRWAVYCILVTYLIASAVGCGRYFFGG